MSDVVFTKVTLVTLPVDVYYSAVDNQNFREEARTIRSAMIDHGKTAGNVWTTTNTETDKITVYRSWINLEAAEEWLAALGNLHTKYQLSNISAEIQDNNY